MPGSTTGNKGQRKFGRGLRSPAHQKYNLYDMHTVNKLKHIRSHIKRLKAKIKRFTSKFGYDPTGMIKELTSAEKSLKRLS